MGEKHQGGCVCGAARYELSGEPITTYCCHCTRCQSRSGSAFGISMIVSEDSLNSLEGELTEHVLAVEDRQYPFQRCAECGTPLWATAPHLPGVAVLFPGTLDDSGWVKPKAHIWTQSAQKWVRFDEHDVTFETQPEDLAQLLEL